MVLFVRKKYRYILIALTFSSKTTTSNDQILRCCEPGGGFFKFLYGSERCITFFVVGWLSLAEIDRLNVFEFPRITRGLDCN